MSALDLAELAEQVATAIPRPDGDGVLLALVTYRRLARGAPVRVDALASEAGLPPSRALEILTACEVAFDERGAIVGFGGLSLTPTAHRFEVDGVGLYTWCAWDALFLPPLLGKPGRLTTTCPVTRQQIHVVITPDRVESVQPSTAVMSFLPPTCCGADIISRFCHFVLVFASAQAGDQWTANHPGTFLLSIAEAFELGGLVNTARYGPLTAPGGQTR
jgi:alkylmercury lyase